MKQIVCYLLFLFPLALLSQNDLLISYELETTRSKKNADEDDLDYESAFQTGNLSVQITDGSSFTIRNPKKKTSILYNFNTETITWYNGDTIHRIVPLFYLADYRVAEYENYRKKTSVLEKAGVQTPVDELQNLESYLSVEYPENNVRKNIAAKPKKDSLIFICEKRTITRVHFSINKLDEVYKDNYRLFLIYQANLHLSVTEKILADGRVPDYLEYSYNHGGEHVVCRMMVESIEPEMEPLQEFEADTMQWSHRDIFTLGGIIDTMSKMVYVGVAEPPDSNLYISRSDSLSETGEHLGALLCLLEYMSCSGKQPINSIKQLMGYKNEAADSSLKRYLLCAEKPTDERDRQLKLERLDELMNLSIPYGYIMHITAAGYSKADDPKKSAEHFYEALSQSPLMTGAYMEAGDLYARMNNFEDAWRCYEIAIRLNPDHPAAKNIVAKKEGLKKKQPQYFAKN